jgi:hypothetical protein
MAHPPVLLQTKTHLGPQQTKTHPEPAQAWALMKDRLAVWRIHTRIHTS